MREFSLPSDEGGIHPRQAYGYGYGSHGAMGLPEVTASAES
jgi:hypothetical protein